MILNEEQKSIIRTLVSNEVSYQETYLEVYDHIISSLEARSSINDFQKAYAEVLEEDFGGHSGIEKLEEIREKVVREEITQKKWNFFFEFFKGPAIIISLLVVVLCYYGFHSQQFVYWLVCITGLMTILPFFILCIGNFFIRSKEKKSINDNALSSAAVLIGRIIIGLNFISFLIGSTPLKFKHNHFISVEIASFIGSTIFLFVTFYGLAVLRLYKNEFKRRVAGGS